MFWCYRLRSLVLYITGLYKPSPFENCPFMKLAYFIGYYNKTFYLLPGLQLPCSFLKRIYLFIFRKKGIEGERERNINVWLPLTCPPLGNRPTTQACALTGNRTSDPSVHRSALNPRNHTSQGSIHVLVSVLYK